MRPGQSAALRLPAELTILHMQGHPDPYGLIPSPPPADAHAQYERPYEGHDQPRYLSVAEAY